MKKINFLLLTIVSFLLFTACNKITYHKTKSGLVYKIFPSSSKDSLISDGQIVKFQVITKLNDSVMYSSYGKLPAYVKIAPLDRLPYNVLEILPLMKSGDSAVTVQMADTILNRAEQLPPGAKKGDKINTSVRILKVFSNDSLAMADFNIEKEKDMPRQLQEQKEQMAKMKKERAQQELKEEMELEKSGEITRELQTMETYLSGKKINAQRTGKGTFVEIKQQGTGPAADSGKYVNVKYAGRLLRNDSVFQSNSYSFQVGQGDVMPGWDEGLKLFRQGGSGTLYIPGFRAYAGNPPAGSPFKPFEALIFDITVTEVSDQPIITKPAQPANK